MIVFKLFRTPEHYYLFDRNKNKILSITQKEYEELDLLYHKKINLEDVQCIQKYQKHGFLQESVLEEVVHPETDYIQHHVEHNLKMLILQVTQNCNLRCDYCAYSGKYENRVHTNKEMTMDTAIKSIDYLFKHSEQNERGVSISFYGGEPLLKLQFIKECVAYVEEHYPDRLVSFGMTTNGTLLTPEVADYLVAHKFNITISLDGSRESHDANRKFVNGKGSFDVIMNNIKQANLHNKDFIKHLRFNTVLNPKVEYGAVSRYFNTEEVICDADIGMSFMDDLNCKEDIIFGEEFISQRKYALLKAYLIMLKKLKGVKISNTEADVKTAIDMDYRLLSDKHKQLGKRCHHSGPCIPGASRMFVNADNYVFPCEKVPDTSEALRIGTVENWIDIEKVTNVMNIGKLNEEDCKKCWAFSWCSMCAMFANEQGSLKADAIRRRCTEARLNAEQGLINICVLKELGYQFEREEIYE